MKELNRYTRIINEEIAGLEYPETAPCLYEPVKYVLSLGGKRIRPVLALMSGEMFGASTEEVLPAAVALEVFHNFTLLHDDLMDKAEIRRGKPVVHRVWNENAAILSGDAMMILAYREISRMPDRCMKEILSVFTEMALEICEGQQYDMEFEKTPEVAETAYLEMIRLKTAVLLAAALKMGAITAGTSSENTERISRFGENIGLAFQLKDDWLDVYGDPTVFGKNIGGDILNNKKTYLLIKALELAEGAEKRELLSWLEAASPDPERKIKAVTSVYDRLGVGNRCEAAMENYYKNALKELDAVSVSLDRKEPLRLLAARLLNRNI